MLKPKWPGVTLTVLLLMALVVGVAYFAGLTAPESYPEMSSLNSGPKGAKLLFDALAKMHPLTVNRNYSPFSQWRPKSTTILFLSLTSLALDSAEKDDLIELERLARANNRVVLCIPDDSVVVELNKKKPPLVRTRGGIQVFKKEGKPTKDTDAGLVLDYDSSWQPVNGLAAAVEKHFDKGGAVVVALHSEDFSNESLATDADVLDEVPLLIGRNTAVVFDETHLGIEESGSVAALARHYKLQGLFAGLLLVVCLFIWNQSVSFPPPAQFENSEDKQVLGADARSTLRRPALVRHLTPQTLLESCIAEWNRMKPQQRLSGELTAKRWIPVATYWQLQESLPKPSAPDYEHTLRPVSIFDRESKGRSWQSNYRSAGGGRPGSHCHLGSSACAD